MKRNRGFSSDFCMACCALLAPYSKICPSCGTDNTWVPRQGEPVDIPDMPIPDGSLEDVFADDDSSWGEEAF